MEDIKDPIETQIEKDLMELMNLSTDNMPVRKKIAKKLEEAVDSIKFNEIGDQKASTILAVTGLVSTLSGVLNDMEKSIGDQIRIKQKEKRPDNIMNDEQSATKTIADFIKALNTTDIRNIKLKDDNTDKTGFFDETLLDKEILKRDITCSTDEISTQTDKAVIDRLIEEYK